MLVCTVEFFSGALHAVDGVLEVVGQGVHRVSGVGYGGEVVDPEPAVVLLVFEPGVELTE